MRENAESNPGCVDGFWRPTCRGTDRGMADGWGWAVCGYESTDGVVTDEKCDLEDGDVVLVERVSRSPCGQIAFVCLQRTG